MKIKPDQLSEAIELELESYSDEIREGLTALVKKTANVCVKTLKQTSPKRTGVYAKSWTKKLKKSQENPEAVVYNKNRSFLTHLLELGHEKEGGGFVSGIVHIQTAADQVQETLFDGVVDLIEKTS